MVIQLRFLFKRSYDNLYIDELKQYEMFYDNLSGINKIDLQAKSLQVWILMEACNISSRLNEVLIDEIIEDIDLNNL